MINGDKDDPLDEQRRSPCRPLRLSALLPPLMVKKRLEGETHHDLGRRHAVRPSTDGNSDIKVLSLLVRDAVLSGVLVGLLQGPNEVPLKGPVGKGRAALKVKQRGLCVRCDGRRREETLQGLLWD